MIIFIALEFIIHMVT